jgi:hypothetical protein
MKAAYIVKQRIWRGRGKVDPWSRWSSKKVRRSRYEFLEDAIERAKRAEGHRTLQRAVFYRRELVAGPWGRPDDAEPLPRRGRMPQPDLHGPATAESIRRRERRRPGRRDRRRLEEAD